jgi:hypothetical protein
MGIMNCGGGAMQLEEVVGSRSVFDMRLIGT